MEDLSRRYEEHHRASRDGGDFVFVPERIPFLVAAVGGPGHRVLDLGCRAGAVSRHFLPGNTVVGLDVDRSALRRAAALGIETVVANAEEELPFPDASFDVVVAGRAPRAPARPGGCCRRGDPRPATRRRAHRVGAERLPAQEPASLSRRAEPRGRPDPSAALLPVQDRSAALGFADVRVGYVGGRLRRLSGRLFARDMVFAGRVPSGVAGTIAAAHGRRAAA